MKDTIESGGDYDAALHELEAILEEYEDKFYNYMTGEDTLYNYVSSTIINLGKEGLDKEEAIDDIDGTISCLESKSKWTIG